MDKTHRTLFSAVLAASRDGAAPEWIELFPKGPAIKARDGRSWTLDAAAVLDAFVANQGPLAIDWEHAQAHRAPQGEEAPAAGWIVALEERGGAVWGKVEWTPKAQAQISAREYRFISPEFRFDRDGRIFALEGAGLVNRPALVMAALSRKASDFPKTKPETQNMEKIAKALGLEDTANEAAILEALAARETSRTALCAALGVDASADAAAMEKAASKLKADHETALAAKGGTSVEVAALKKDLAETRTALAAIQTLEKERAIDNALDTAVKEGKVTPASRDTYRALCALEGGIEKFEALCKTLPVIGAPSGLDGRQPASQSGQDGVDPVALAAKARAYQDEQAKLGFSVSTSDAVAHVQTAQ